MLLATVLIDWFTVAAQIINFLILVALLKYFLYGRILEAMDKRQARIAANWEEAEQQKQQAEQSAASFRAKEEELVASRKQLLDQARVDANAKRQALLEEVRSEVDDSRARWQATVEEEAESFLRLLRERVARQVCSISRRALADLADEELERQIARAFLSRLQTIDEPVRKELLTSLRRGGGQATVRSAFDVPADLQERLVEALRKALAGDLDVAFETSPELMCGIALHTDGYKLAWELDDYLDGLEQEISQSLVNT